MLFKSVGVPIVCCIKARVQNQKKPMKPISGNSSLVLIGLAGWVAWLGGRLGWVAGLAGWLAWLGGRLGWVAGLAGFVFV